MGLLKIDRIVAKKATGRSQDKHKPRRHYKKFSSREFVLEKMFRKILWKSPCYSNADCFKEIATPPKVLLELLRSFGGPQRLDVGGLPFLVNHSLPLFYLIQKIRYPKDSYIKYFY